jgi:TolB protein
LQQLTFGSAQERVPAWSADGSHLAYQSNEDGEFDVFILNVSTGATRKITDNDCTDLAPSWSPNGNKLAFYSECDGNREIYTMNVDGSNRKQLTETGGDIYNWFPIWSHDGTRITFSSNRSGGKYQVYVMNADGSNQQAIARGCVSSFSPDDQWLVFTTYCSDSGDIWLIRPDGTDLRQLTTNDFNKNPSWAPDGQWIVFQLELSETDHDLYVMDINGANWFQLTSGIALDGSPVWGPGE